MPIGREVDRRKKNSYPGGVGEHVEAKYPVMRCGERYSLIVSYPLYHSFSLVRGNVAAFLISPLKKFCKRRLKYENEYEKF